MIYDDGTLFEIVRRPFVAPIQNRHVAVETERQPDIVRDLCLPTVAVGGHSLFRFRILHAGKLADERVADDFVGAFHAVGHPTVRACNVQVTLARHFEDG